MYLEIMRAYWNDKESNGPRSEMGFVQVYCDKTASRRNYVTFVVYPVHAVRLNFCAGSECNLLTMDIHWWTSYLLSTMMIIVQFRK